MDVKILYSQKVERDPYAMVKSWL